MTNLRGQPKVIGLLCALCAAAIALAGLLGTFVAIKGILGGARQLMVWFLLGFEPVVLLAGIMGILTGLSRIRHAPSLAMFCIGGCTLVAGILIEPSLIQRALGSRVAPTPIGGISILPIALSHIGLALCMFALSGLSALMRDPSKSIPRVAIGLLLGLPVAIGLGAAYWLLRGSGRGSLANVPPVFTVIGICFGSLIIGGFFAASAHYLITGFGAGLDQPSPESPAKAS